MSAPRPMSGAAVATVLVLVVLAASPAPWASATPAEGPGRVTRDVQPVVFLGALLDEISVVPDHVERPPAPLQEEQQDGVRVLAPVSGAPAGWPTSALAAYRFDAGPGQHVQVPLQVDERFARYLTNYASGFAMYSQSDMEITYAFDSEGTRRTCEGPGGNTTAALCPGPVTTPDPVPGLDHDDELVVMWRDLGARSPGFPPGAGVHGAYQLEAHDPLAGDSRFVTIVAYDGPVAQPPGYVQYQRDADADVYIESNHGGYGGAPGGPCFKGDGVDAPMTGPFWACAHRRPKDSATVTTASYRFHYAGRWKLDGLAASDGAGGYGVSLIDRWKGRAFQQREGNAADVGGFEDENDWVKSSVTLGERVGPVRVLRETWGADSGTHVTRLDAFYADFFSQTYHMRVHPIPPDGVYAFWDHTVGAVDTYYTPLRPGGVHIDGVNDELYGLNSEWQEDLLGQPYFTIDVPDPTLQGVTAYEMWDEVTGDAGTMVTYLSAPGTQSGVLNTYYRDDLAFDDGTGRDPAFAYQRDGCDPDVSVCQGSFGAHGIHFFVTGDTDNLFLPAPSTEFVARSTQYVFPGRMPDVGEDVAAIERVPVVVSGSGPI